MDEGDRDLPLHDEAMARSKWRGGETLIEQEALGDSGPASEIDDSASGGDSGTGSSDSLAENLAQRPPD
jgi:hypothetical protein